MKKTIYLIITMLTLLTSFTSCEEENKKDGKATAKILSGPYELLLVANKSWLSSGEGMEFRNIVERPIIGIPQPEPNFRVTTLSPRDYKGKYTMYGNIFIADINDTLKKAKLNVEYDVHAQPQVIITASGPTSSSILIMLESKKDSILDIFVQHEIDRERKYLVKTHSKEVSDQIKKQFGMTMLAPADIDKVQPSENFFWATSKKRDNTLNICVYTYPFTSEDDFSLTNFIQKRDSVMKLYVQGEKEDQYMKTDSRFVSEKATIRDGKFTYEVRGLWIMEHDAMGGPFVSYAQLDTINNEIVVAEGFIFAPNEKKRPLIRELEASLQTLTLPTKKK